MTNVARGQIAVDIAQQNYTLTPTMDLLIRFETRFGTLWQVGKNLSEGAVPTTEIVAMMDMLTDGKIAHTVLCEDVLQKGVSVYVGYIAEFLNAVLASKIENLEGDKAAPGKN